MPGQRSGLIGCTISVVEFVFKNKGVYYHKRVMLCGTSVSQREISIFPVSVEHWLMFPICSSLIVVVTCNDGIMGTAFFKDTGNPRSVTYWRFKLHVRHIFF